MFAKGYEAPWKVKNHLWRILAAPFIRTRLLLQGVKIDPGCKFFGMPIIQRYGGSTIKIGANTELRSWLHSNPLAPIHPIVLATRTAEAHIIVGPNCGLTGTTIVAAAGITIGRNVLIGANCSIVDTDFHPLTPAEREIDINAGIARPIVIEDDVFIGMNALILKGVTIGAGAVIGAGSVVVKDVPKGFVAAGNPAKIIREV